MAIRDGFLAEFNHEVQNTRKALERIPADKFDWAPHAKSMKLGALGAHLAGLPGRAAMVMKLETFDARSPEAVAASRNVPTTPAQLVERLDKSAEEFRAALAAAPDEEFTKVFTLKAGEQTIFSLPRRAALRAFILNHSVHHRGQLTVYLRLLDVPVPAIYGPSADEKPQLVS